MSTEEHHHHPPSSSSSTSTSKRNHRRCRNRKMHMYLPRPFLLTVMILLSFLGVPHPNRRYRSSHAITWDGYSFLAFAEATTTTTETTTNENEDGTLHLRGGSNQPPSPSSTSSSSSAQILNKQPTLNQILIKAGKRGIGGGIPGAIAGAIQVLCLMWLRTIINYQYRYGTTFRQAIRTLYKDGGIRRFYRGLWFALVQAPLARFGSTAANDGVEALLTSLKGTMHWGPGRMTVIASIVVGVWRVVIMPIDTCKTVLQVDSAEGFRNLMRKVRAGKIVVLYQGSLASAISAIISHYPWFYTYNFLTKNESLQTLIKSSLLRNAGIGFLASVVSDTVANCIRVIKTTKQAIASKHTVGYAETISMILAADGWKGLFGRGLKTRILANGFQSVVFTIIWRGLAGRMNQQEQQQQQHSEESNSSSSSSSSNRRTEIETVEHDAIVVDEDSKYSDDYD